MPPMGNWAVVHGDWRALAHVKQAIEHVLSAEMGDEL